MNSVIEDGNNCDENDIESQREIVSDDDGAIVATATSWSKLYLILRARSRFLKKATRTNTTDREPLLRSHDEIVHDTVSSVDFVAPQSEVLSSTLANSDESTAEMEMILVEEQTSSHEHFDEQNTTTKKTFARILLDSCNKYFIVLLVMCAALSLGFGIQEEGLDTGWQEGAVIFLGIITIVLVSTVRDVWILKKLSSRKDEITVDVIRGGQQQTISMLDVVPGDIIFLQEGQQIPADGLFISDGFLKVDDKPDSTINDQNSFLFCGGKVINGNGNMLVTSVGTNTVLGKMMGTISNTTLNRKSNLEIQLDKVNSSTQVIGLIVTSFILIILFLRFELTRGNEGSEFPDLKGKSTFLRQCVDAVKRISMKPRGKISPVTTTLTLLIIGMTEGIPVVVTIMIAYWNKKALARKGTVHDLLACVTMGSNTFICTDKDCGLSAKVDMLYIGEDLIRDVSKTASNVLETLYQGICTPALIDGSPPCNLIEEALISWASQKFHLSIENLKQQCKIINFRSLDAKGDGYGVLMSDREIEGTILHRNGPATTILSMCTQYYDRKGQIKTIENNERMKLMQIINAMQCKHLKTLAHACRKVDNDNFEDENLILIGLVGLNHPCREAINAFKNVGVNIVLVSGDTVSSLKTMATECGILHDNETGAIVLGEMFRNSSDEERMRMVDDICIMAECQASDKLLLVKCLRQKGHIVTFVGLRTEETPCLKEADVGITFGNHCTEMAKQSADIVISEGDFSCLVTIMGCGRCAYENIQKFIQVELTMTITWFVINITMTACFGDAPVTAIQLFWLYLIVAIQGGVASLTKPATKILIKRSPTNSFGLLITSNMWINIFTQALCQTVVLVTFQFKGKQIFTNPQEVCKTMIFNAFVVCQTFNQLNARKMDIKNVFKGIHQDFWFLFAVGLTMMLQVAFIEIAHLLADSERLNGRHWVLCFFIGLISWFTGWSTKCIITIIT